MDNIYVLMTGEYSDTEIQGFVDSEEEAKKICDYHNATSCLHYWREWHYWEVERIKENVPDVKSVYVVTVKLENWLGSGWKLSDIRSDCKCFLSDAPEVKEARYCEITDPRGDKKILEAVCDVVLREPDFDKARKIAQDRLYKKLAEGERL